MVMARNTHGYDFDNNVIRLRGSMQALPLKRYSMLIDR
ncbi:MAG: hypothetical protein ACJAQ6_000108 [Arenicella sp.]|jgi:hypothetical protein